MHEERRLEMRNRFRWGIVTGLIAFGVSVAVLRWWLKRQSQRTKPAQSVEYVIPCDAGEELSDARVPRKAKSVLASPSTRGRDDLRRIEGIGPKSTQVLAQAGIVSFRQLAATDVGLLRQILREAGMRIVFPDTWPEQASLAAAGDWEGLSALQAQLDHGRRTGS
jgi:predicted flap endonuclease-1-like 5' DNA nuclease